MLAEKYKDIIVRKYIFSATKTLITRQLPKPRKEILMIVRLFSVPDWIPLAIELKLNPLSSQFLEK